MQEEKRHPGDPRKDMVADHRHWEVVLYNCWHLENDLYYLLHGIRCCGAELILSQSGYRLLPGELSEAEWEDIKNRLSPFKDKLIEVFKASRIGRVSNEKLPDGIFEEAILERQGTLFS